MPLFDLPLAQLEAYRSAALEPADFDAFWRRTLDEVRARPLDARFERVDDAIYQHIEVFDVTFAGWAGQPVRGWLLRPTGASGALPALVSYIGYGGGRSLPLDHVAPVAAGLVHLVMDTRGQGSAWSPGDTADDAPTGPHFPGFLTRGIAQPETYYYRRVFVDAVRAVDAAIASGFVDASRVAVGGGSQGGGLALAAAGLLGERVRVLLADVPFLCDFRRATEVVDTMPYGEISAYLRVHRARVEETFRTLSYFDGVNFAPRVRARALFSVGLMDQVCPPSTVFGAYNRLTSPKEIRVFPYNTHEGGGPQHAAERLRFVRRWL